MKTTKETARLYYCSCCHQQVVICSCCDRGNIYCGSLCSQQTRTLNHRIANQKYQNSLKGRLKHAQRQRHYRKRKMATAQKVTDQGSPVLPAYDLLPDRLDEGKSQPSNTTHCHFCGNIVPLFLRNGFLRHHKDNHFSSWPLGP
jgi:hypothetical protein